MIRGVELRSRFGVYFFFSVELHYHWSEIFPIFTPCLPIHISTHFKLLLLLNNERRKMYEISHFFRSPLTSFLFLEGRVNRD